MPNIYDNINLKLGEALRDLGSNSNAADCCVGYFNLRGWDQLADLVERYQGYEVSVADTGEDGSCCRVLIGMQRAPEMLAQAMYSGAPEQPVLDPRAITRAKKEAARSLKTQLETGLPTEQAETALRRLAIQLRAHKVHVHLFIKYPLHAKLYLLHRKDKGAPLIGFVGSSNLTFAGLRGNGELNVDVKDDDAAKKLHDWFLKHWKESFDISDELASLIETSWAAEQLESPYHVYLKMAYHLSEDARVGDEAFPLPKDLRGKLADFQESAVGLTARQLQMRGGALLADVVGLGKTFVATAVARVIQDDEGGDVLIICPPNLKPMWERHTYDFALHAKIVSLGKVQDELPTLRRHRLVIIDESHNLRNREGARYKVIRDYIRDNESRCLLLTATPYNKHYEDLGNQLRLFLDEKKELGVRPEKYFKEQDEREFAARFQASPRSLAAFEQSEHADDWRDLLRLYMVRRTRGYILENYAKTDDETGRPYVTIGDHGRYHFPTRTARNLTFELNDKDITDQYAQLYSERVVDVINNLELPRYGLAGYVDDEAVTSATTAQQQIIEDLGRAGKRLMGFCRTNLFKRLESCGYAFLLSVERHVLRNLTTLYALEQGLDVPIGTQDVAMLDPAMDDKDEWEQAPELGLDGDGEQEPDAATGCETDRWTELRQRAQRAYEGYAAQWRGRFKWLPARLFQPTLAQELLSDAQALCTVLEQAGEWQAAQDAKLDALRKLLGGPEGSEKVLVFTQFEDTALYLERELKRKGLTDVAALTGNYHEPTAICRRFSPTSNCVKSGEIKDELRILVATDVLSEGQNLQDCHTVVNFDLPWAIIRLVQRAGRVDRIGQKHSEITVYSFLPAAGVDQIISLQARLLERLRQNNEVVGSDEQFFDEHYVNAVRDLYTEKASPLEDEPDEDVDLTSFALQVWNKAVEEDRQRAQALPALVHATRPYQPSQDNPAGALTFMRFGDDTFALVRTDATGEVVSQSLGASFRAAECKPETPALERAPGHYDWVAAAVEAVRREGDLATGRLGRPTDTRRRVYERLDAYRREHQGELLPTDLDRAIDALYHSRLLRSASERLRSRIKRHASDADLADLVIELYSDDALVVPEEDADDGPPQLICSLGLRWPQGETQE